jgi:hypothetical protein
MNLETYLKETDTKKEDMKFLPSVGTVLNVHNGDTMAVNLDSTFDFDSVIKINEIENEEWFDTLDTLDEAIVNAYSEEYVDNLLDETEVDYLEMKAELHYGI